MSASALFSLSEKDIVKYLLEQGIDEEKAVWAAQLSQGSISRALLFAREEDLEQIWDTVIAIIKDLALGRRAAIFEISEKIQGLQI